MSVWKTSHHHEIHKKIWTIALPIHQQQLQWLLKTNKQKAEITRFHRFGASNIILSKADVVWESTVYNSSPQHTHCIRAVAQSIFLPMANLQAIHTFKMSEFPCLPINSITFASRRGQWEDYSINQESSHPRLPLFVKKLPIVDF